MGSRMHVRDQLPGCMLPCELSCAWSLEMKERVTELVGTDKHPGTCTDRTLGVERNICGCLPFPLVGTPFTQGLQVAAR